MACTATILVVEDDHDLRTGLAFSLRQERYEVAAVDASIPGADPSPGVSFAGRISEKNVHAPVSCCTGHAYADHSQEWSGGELCTLLKPFEIIIVDLAHLFLVLPGGHRDFFIGVAFIIIVGFFAVFFGLISRAGC